LLLAFTYQFSLSSTVFTTAACSSMYQVTHTLLLRTVFEVHTLVTSNRIVVELTISPTSLHTEKQSFRL